jgi:selenocysteine lyase/cysteine desulfurase
MSMDIEQVRAQFPALQSGAVFFDNPGARKWRAR